MKWSKIASWERPAASKCATQDCRNKTKWYGEAGDVGSYYCDECRSKIDAKEKR